MNMDLYITGHRWLIALVLMTICTTEVISQGSHYKRVCYFTNWSKYRLGQAKFTADHIDPFLCTHLIFAFGDFDDNGNLRKLDSYHDSKDFETFKSLKQQNTELRTLLAIGGWNFGSIKFSKMAGSPMMRKTFVSSTVSYLRSNGFDGLDIDWEYPAERGGEPADRRNLVTLCKELKDAFITESQQAGREPLLLTAAVPASRYKGEVGYDVPALNNYLDFFSIMTYDFHGGWENKVGQNSPLSASPIEDGDDKYLNIREAIQWWHRAGVPKHKLVVGLASYGRSFQLTSSSYGLGAPAAKGIPGPYTREGGFWAYYEICMEIDNDYNGAHRGTVYYDTDQEVPFYVKDNFWVGYDNERSIKAKTKWMKESNLGGFMVWSLALDDFNKMCNYTTRSYPLIHAAIEELGNVVMPAPTPRPTFRPTAPPRPRTTRPRPIGGAFRPKPTVVVNHQTPGVQPFVPRGKFIECPSRGHHYFPDHNDCQKYIECHEGQRHSRGCPSGLHWDVKVDACNWEHLAGCTTG
ncbi:chitinase-3-like protein 1 [Haliotis rubra]|uniref:chitinase-3-like protein 1 n=1 Tax=Haliotis rubra TaxID=36100 RepID=UPI001EE5EE56|nr:chitinase-3-like protein 1 [Haliotis rubra]